MELSPKVYHWLVRPPLYNNLYLNKTFNMICENFELHNKNILDFGCGVGSNCRLFSPKGYIGIDCDHKRISYAKKKYKEYSFLADDGNKIPIEDKSMDYIFIMAVLHHITPEDISIYLKRFHKILKNDGKIMVIEPCVFEKSYFSNWFMRKFDKGQYICDEKGYIKIFKDNYYNVKVKKRFKKSFVYNEIFFVAESKL